MGQFFENDSFENLFNQALELWIRPELERRRELGIPFPSRIPGEIVTAQVLFHPDEPTVVRFNEEVRAVLKTDRVGRPGRVNSEEPITVHSVQLTESDADRAHLTLVYVGGKWQVAWDFRYYGATNRATLESAEQYLATAREAAQKSRPRPFVTNLCQATELMAKVLLSAVVPDSGVIKSKKHAAIQSELHKRRRGGLVADKFPRFLSDLFGLRQRAGYDAGPFALTAEQYVELLATANEMYGAARALIADRSPDY